MQKPFTASQGSGFPGGLPLERLALDEIRFVANSHEQKRSPGCGHQADSSLYPAQGR
jgi:hypothetical protein